MTMKPSISLRYQLQLNEFQEAFRIASFGQKGIMAWITTIIATGFMLWGFKLGFDNGGKFFIIFGATFSIMQLLIRFWLVPMMFKRQFIKMQLDKRTQGIDLYQTEFSLWNNDKSQTFPYSEVVKTAQGSSCYVLEMKNRVSVIIPTRAFADEQQHTLFKQQFKL